MLFNGTIGGKTFTNHVVATGTVDVGKKEIDEIVITDITAPAAKETLDTSASTSTTGCDLSAVSWTYGDTSVTEAGFDKAYTAKVVVTADSNHTFGSSLTAKVNGETASVTNNGDGTVTVTYTFAKTTYDVGDTLDLTGGKITVSYNNGTSVDIDINGTMIEGFDSTTAGEKTVTVKYSGFITSFKVTVSKGSFTVEPQPGNMDGAYSINVRFCACASLTFMHSRIEVSKILVFILSATVSSDALTSLERFALLLYFVRRSPATVSFGF